MFRRSIKVTDKKPSGVLGTADNISISSHKIMLSPSLSNYFSIYEKGSSSVAFVTTPDETIAKNLANALVSEKLAACVNIIPQITSIYIWDGKINEDAEVLMMVKTTTALIDQVITFIKENHPYSVAEVITFPIENGNEPYLDWITKSVKTLTSTEKIE